MRILHNPSKSRTGRDLGLLDIDVACVDGVAVVSVAGELDASNHQRLQECLCEVRSAGATEVIVDVEHLTFMDSTGLSVLVASRRRMEADGGTFSVLAPTHIVKRLFDVTGQLQYQMIDAAAV
jgi:anti-sigma B factor antagonist